MSTPPLTNVTARREQGAYDAREEWEAPAAPQNFRQIALSGERQCVAYYIGVVGRIACRFKCLSGSGEITMSSPPLVLPETFNGEVGNWDK